MEHADARELLETAAVEPLGFERLAAGDTPEAAALAGHLAGCPECAAEMERLRRASALIGEAIREIPPPDLRERTLAFVAAVGRDRAAGAAVASLPAAARAATGAGNARGGWAAGQRLGIWAAAAAAVLAIAALGGALIVARSNGAAVAQLTEEVESMTKVATWTLRIGAEPDARRVELAGADANTTATGTLAFSPGSTELVAFAHGLPIAPPGMEYRCWMDVGGNRSSIGKMFPGSGIAYWVGKVASISSAVPGTRFGVSLVPVGGGLPPEPDHPILIGEL